MIGRRLCYYMRSLSTPRMSLELKAQTTYEDTLLTQTEFYEATCAGRAGLQTYEGCLKVEMHSALAVVDGIILL